MKRLALFRRRYSFLRMVDLQQFNIRVAQSGDAHSISDLVNLAYSKWVPLIGRHPLPMDVDYTEALIKHRIDLLQTGNYLAALIETFEDGDSLVIENICVAPRFQRQGLGKRLLEHAEQIAKRAQKSSMKLDTNKLFTGNVDLYHRAGFITEWETPIEGGIHVHMSKSLAP